MNSFDKSVNNVVEKLHLNNEYVTSTLIIFLIVYASMAAPKLPPKVIAVFENNWVRLIIFFLIAYVAQHNATVAIVAAVALLITLQTLNRYSMNKTLQQFVDQQAVTPMTNSDGGAKRPPQSVQDAVGGCGTGLCNRYYETHDLYPKYPELTEDNDPPVNGYDTLTSYEYAKIEKL